MVFEVCTAIKTLLTPIPDITTLKIGLEPNITPDQYPLIRIVVDENRQGDFNTEDIELTIFFGNHIRELNTIEAIYDYLYSLEDEIKTILNMQ